MPVLEYTCYEFFWDIGSKVGSFVKYLLCIRITFESITHLSWLIDVWLKFIWKNFLYQNKIFPIHPSAVSQTSITNTSTKKSQYIPVHPYIPVLLATVVSPFTTDPSACNRVKNRNQFFRYYKTELLKLLKNIHKGVQ